MNGTCASLSFRALMAAEFIGAFIDNLFKVVLSIYAVQVLATPEAATRYISTLGILFILPYVLFSPLAGYLSDKFAKRRVMIVMNGVKALLACLATWALWTGDLTYLSGMIFLYMAESAFFSPAKQGILPEMLSEEELSKGNGYAQMFTFLGIILGTAAGGLVVQAAHGRLYVTGFIMVVLAVLGWGLSLLVHSQRPEPAVLKRNPLVEMGRAFQGICRDRGLFLTMTALTFFQFMGALFQMNIMVYGAHVLHAPEAQVSVLLLAVSLGIAGGGVLAGKASEGKVELGLVPLGSAGIAAMCFLLGFGGHFTAVLGLLFVLGLCAGFYTVPLNAFFQRYSPPEHRGQYVSAVNIVCSAGTMAAGAFLWVAGGKLGIGADKIFFIASFLAALATLTIVTVLPIALVRLFAWLLAHTVYRLRVHHSYHVPETGGALLIANHISFIDAVLILAALKRPVRFIMHRAMYELPFVHVVCRILKVIPIDPDEGPKSVARSLAQARRAIEEGELVCIFPEGRLTRTGNMLSFNRGFEHIMKNQTAPIIPLYLDNIWGSIYSFANGKYFWKWPRFTLYPVSVVFGSPLAASTTAPHVRQAVQELGAEANILRGAWRKKLHLAFIDEVRRHAFKSCMADSMGLEFSYAKAFAVAVSLSRAVFPPGRRPLESNEMVGVLLPASCMAALANIAVAFAGKVPVNLNFTLSAEAFASCISQCRMHTIITSRAFLEKLGMPARPEMVFLEDIKRRMSPVPAALFFVSALLLPRRALSALYVKGDKTNVDDVATVIFSSGSTGEPKGVMLTHANIFSNIEGMYQVFNVRPSDVVIAALPFFHSFGFTATMCFPLGTAVGAVYHTNPLDAATIGKLAAKHKGTILMGTPTFLSAYVKKCTPEQFKTVRLAVVGAEKLKEPLANAFKEKFGITPFEGYGATELSPIVTVGFPDYVNAVTLQRQVGNKFGKVGHPIPGVAAKVVDPDTFAGKGVDEEGLLLIKGANVMKGYLNNPAKTAEVIRDGWYITGDIAAIDEDGFIKITDRLSRFSKIGGEMVPHVKVEEHILAALGTAEPVIAVAAIPDEKKGERLIVLYTAALDPDTVCRALAAQGLPNLWIPRKESFFKVDAIPLLGTGKADLKKIKALALALAQPAVLEDNV